MAIKIPSKSIYGVENPKIRDNIINRIDLDCTQPTSPYVKKDVNISSSTINIDSDISFSYFEPKSASKIISQNIGGAGNPITYTQYRYLKTSIGVSSDLFTYVEKFKNNYYVQDFYNLTSEDTTLTYTRVRTPIKVKIPYTDGVYDFDYANNISWEDWEQDTSKSIETEIKSTIQLDLITNNGETDNSLKIDLDFKDTDKYVFYQSSHKSFSNYEEEYYLKLRVSYRTINVSAYTGIEGGGYYVGYKEELIPSFATIQINGTTLGIDLNDTTLQYGSGDKPFKVDNNELMQTTNFLSSTNENALESQYTSILEQYANGKEYAVINCSISEYKDQDGNVVINPKESDKMIFEMYDIVIPYKQGFVNGVQQDVPLSKYPNGEPKQFQVLGVKPHTRGVLRQELTLQEISQSTLQNK